MYLYARMQSLCDVKKFSNDERPRWGARARVISGDGKRIVSLTPLLNPWHEPRNAGLKRLSALCPRALLVIYRKWGPADYGSCLAWESIPCIVCIPRASLSCNFIARYYILLRNDLFCICAYFAFRESLLEHRRQCSIVRSGPAGAWYCIYTPWSRHIRRFTFCASVSALRPLPPLTKDLKQLLIVLVPTLLPQSFLPVCWLSLVWGIGSLGLARLV